MAMTKGNTTQPTTSKMWPYVATLLVGMIIGSVATVRTQGTYSAMMEVSQSLRAINATLRDISTNVKR